MDYVINLSDFFVDYIMKNIPSNLNEIIMTVDTGHEFTAITIFNTPFYYINKPGVVALNIETGYMTLYNHLAKNPITNKILHIGEKMTVNGIDIIRKGMPKDVNVTLLAKYIFIRAVQVILFLQKILYVSAIKSFFYLISLFTFNLLKNDINSIEKIITRFLQSVIDNWIRLFELFFNDIKVVLPYKNIEDKDINNLLNNLPISVINLLFDLTDFQYIIICVIFISVSVYLLFHNVTFTWNLVINICKKIIHSFFVLISKILRVNISVFQYVINKLYVFLDTFLPKGKALLYSYIKYDKNNKEEVSTTNEQKVEFNQKMDHLLHTKYHSTKSVVNNPEILNVILSNEVSQTAVQSL